MSGVHLRIVVTIFVAGGIVSVLPFALSLFVEGVHSSAYNVFGSVGSAAIAILFSRGSNIARSLMNIYSIFGVLVCGLLLLLFLLAGNFGLSIVVAVTGRL